MTHHIGPILIASLLAVALLIAEHVTLWNRPWRLTRIASYAVGTATLFTGFVLWAALENGPIDPWHAVIAVLVIDLSGGAAIITAYWFRNKLQERDAVTAKARNLWVEAINESEHAESGMD